MADRVTPRIDAGHAGIALALGGGGARGLAHLGVLALLEQNNIPIDAIVGCSSGGLVAAMWLAYGGTEGAVRRWREYLAAGFPPAVPGLLIATNGAQRPGLIRRAISAIQGAVALARIARRSYIVDPELSRRVIEFLVPDVSLESLRLPLALVATDYRTGEAVAFDRGPLRHAVVASCSMPGMALPFPDGDRLLIDGGVVAEVPVEQARAASTRPVVAIDTPEDVPDTLPDRPSVPRAFVWADTLTHRALRRRLLAAADLVIAPVVAHVHWSDFARLDEMIEAGKVAAGARLPELLELAKPGWRAEPAAAPANE